MNFFSPHAEGAKTETSFECKAMDSSMFQTICISLAKAERVVRALRMLMETSQRADSTYMEYAVTEPRKFSKDEIERAIDDLQNYGSEEIKKDLLPDLRASRERGRKRKSEGRNEKRDEREAKAKVDETCSSSEMLKTKSEDSDKMLALADMVGLEIEEARHHYYICSCGEPVYCEICVPPRIPSCTHKR